MEILSEGLLGILHAAIREKSEAMPSRDEDSIFEEMDVENEKLYGLSVYHS
jgi:hypothetical protein